MDHPRNGGFVLVVVLGVLALLTVLVLGFSHRALLERRAAAVSLDHSQAMMMARGATQRGIAFVRNRTVGQNYDNGRGNRAPAFEGPFWRDHPSIVEEGLFNIDKGTEEQVDYLIEDLESRWSLNSAPEECFEEADFLDMKLVSEIMERRGKGVTTDVPQPFLAIEELRTLGEFDDEQWFGDEETPGIRDLLTTWGDGRINVNTAPAQVLAMVPDIEPSVVDAVVAYRQGPDGLLNTKDDISFKSFEDMASKLSVSAERLSPLRLYCKLDSRFFTITGFATRRQGKVRAYCTATVEVLKDRVVTLQWREEPLGS